MALALRFLNEAIFSGFAAAMLLELKNGVSVASHGYYLTHQIFTKLFIQEQLSGIIGNLQ